MSLSPFTRGRLALSAPAIKTIAKALATLDPISAVSAGLRVHNGNIPFELNAEPARDLTLIGCDGSGITQTAYGLMHGALSSGFRGITISQIPLFHMCSMEQENVRWTADLNYTHAAVHRKEHTAARVLSFMDLDKTPFLETEELIRFLRDVMQDTSTRYACILVPRLITSPKQDQQHIKAGIISALRTVKEDLGDFVVYLEDLRYHPDDIAFLSTRAAGVIKTVRGTAEEAPAKPDDLCLFSNHALPTIRHYQPGEGHVGVYKHKERLDVMPRIITPYVNTPLHQLDDSVIKALNRIHAEPDVSRLTYIQRLELVSRACGFQNWHAAEAQGRGILDKVRGILQRRPD